MAIIVRHIPTGNEYLLIGTGLGIDKNLLSPRLLRNLLSEEGGGDVQRVALCDPNGQIFWLPSSEVIVTEIDGQQPGDLLPEKILTPPPVSEISEGGDVNTFTGDEDEDEDGDWI